MNPGQGTNFQGWHFLAFNFCSMLFHLLLPILAEENNHLDLVVCTPLRSQELYFSDWYKSFLSIEVVLGYIPLVLECSFGNSKQVIFVELLRIRIVRSRSKFWTRIWFFDFSFELLWNIKSTEKLLLIESSAFVVFTRPRLSWIG